MNPMIRLVIFLMLFMFGSLVSAASETVKIHPDEPSSYTHNTRFSLVESLKAMRLIKESITSFRQITEDTAAEKNIILSHYKHTDWEIQNIRLVNAIITIEGIIRQQEYLIKKLQYESEIKDRENVRTSERLDKNKLKQELKNAEMQYLEFLKSVKLSD